MDSREVEGAGDVRAALGLPAWASPWVDDARMAKGLAGTAVAESRGLGRGHSAHDCSRVWRWEARKA